MGSGRSPYLGLVRSYGCQGTTSPESEMGISARGVMIVVAGPRDHGGEQIFEFSRKLSKLSESPCTELRRIVHGSRKAAGDSLRGAHERIASETRSVRCL
ncbi:hypothetical protein Tco_0562719 [Tanacetum coccineum]